jgi:hypothetical protein
VAAVGSVAAPARGEDERRGDGRRELERARCEGVQVDELSVEDDRRVVAVVGGWGVKDGHSRSPV